MIDERACHWNPSSQAALDDQIAAYDALRRRCAIAHSEAMHWSVLRHADVMRALEDPHTFSNAVSAHLAVPNGMDPPEHGDYRRVIEPYFTPERMAALEPSCRAIAVDLIATVANGREVEWMAECATPFALQSQCAFLDWPAHMQEPLRVWMRKNQEATRSRDRAAMTAVAWEFDSHIKNVLAERRASTGSRDDVASRLLREQVRGRPLSDEEIVSVLRNWTVGELGTIAACVGVLAHYLAQHTNVQTQLREAPALLPTAIEEILRIHPPLIASRRVIRSPVELGGRQFGAGERATLIWASANRDEAVFGNPDELRLDRPPADNLLYGAGIHVCPGAPLARLELRIFMEELLARTSEIALGQTPPVRATYPAGGFASLHIRARPR